MSDPKNAPNISQAPVLAFSEEDKRIANDKLAVEQRKAIANAKNINNSDVDLCEFKGKTAIYYSWGNQQGTEFLAEAVYEKTLASFLKAFFLKIARHGLFHAQGMTVVTNWEN